MNNIFIISDAHTEHMASLSLPFYKNFIDEYIDSIVLLEENHTTQEIKKLCDTFPVTLTKSIRDTYSKYTLILGDYAFFKRVAKNLNTSVCLLNPNPWMYNATSLSLSQNEKDIISSKPVVLILTFSNCSAIVNIELALNKVFTKNAILAQKYFLPTTTDFIELIRENNSLEEDVFIDQDTVSEIVIKSVYLNQETTQKVPRSQIVAFIEQISPSYTILCLDGDKKNNQLHLDWYKNLFWKKPDMIIDSAYYEYLIGGRQKVKVFSVEQLNSSILYKKCDEFTQYLLEDILAKLSLPDNIHIL